MWGYLRYGIGLRKGKSKIIFWENLGVGLGKRKGILEVGIGYKLYFVE